MTQLFPSSQSARAIAALQHSSLTLQTHQWPTAKKEAQTPGFFHTPHLGGTFLITVHLLQAVIPDDCTPYIPLAASPEPGLPQVPLIGITSSTLLLPLAGLPFLLSPRGYLQVILQELGQVSLPS